MNASAPMTAARYLRDAAVFVPSYVLLDWVSYIHPFGQFNITPWSPQPALGIVLMLLGGLRFAPVVFVTIVLADLMVRGAPGGLGVVIATAIPVTAGYAAVAGTLGRLLRPRPDLHSLRQLTLFTAVVVAATALIALAYVGVLFHFDALSGEGLLQGWLRFWVGDAVGVLVTAPLLLAVADPAQRRGFSRLLRQGEAYVQVTLVIAAIWLIFRGLEGDPSHHVYLLFLPLIWTSIRNGLTGAIVAVALVQIGVVLGTRGDSLETLPVIELQALVAALTLTALYLGVMVDERGRANERAARSLRLAAAGEMAGAIAHEMNQPLTALANYGTSGRQLLQAGKTEAVAGVLDHMMAEAQRAAEIVRRLRDFFREGTTRLEQVPVEDLLGAAGAVAAELKGGRDIAVSAQCESGLPPMLVDRLQMELVLRNLVANAIESAGAAGSPEKRVDLHAGRQGARHLRIAVRDTGPGVREEDRERVFEAFVSGKPTGMGLGLAVSRALAEAHGGILECRPGSHGEFHLILPLSDREPA